ncbi:hypothetical protein BuS5_03361 [Desulfosarcina sp. BuS5]|nr:hypothetical protein [Desulfosarcina sp. BuS5]WDN90390.1 hypothetical protein BuS5_03361 [Desulfosarcina sp. BuS5]
MKENKRNRKEKNGIVVFDKGIKNGDGWLSFCCFGPYMPSSGGW